MKPIKITKRPTKLRHRHRRPRPRRHIILSKKNKMEMLCKAREQCYNLPFPEELLANKEGETDEDNQPEPKMSGRYHVGDITLPNGHVVKDAPNNYKVVPEGELGKFKNARAIVNAMTAVWKGKQASPTIYSQHFHAAYASAYPTVTSEQQAVLTPVALFTRRLLGALLGT